VQTSADGVTRTMVYDVFGQNVADYTGSGGATLERENIYRGGQLLATETPLTSAPSGLATNPSTSNIALSWTAASGATNYRVERKAAGGSYASIGTSATTNLTDNNVTSGSAYLYRVCAADGGGNCTSGYTNVALGMALMFTDDPISVGVTTVKAQHVTELRNAVNAVRSLAGLSAASWTDSDVTGVLIKAIHVQELRDRLNEALTALGISASSFTDSTLQTGANGTLVKAVHFAELRQRVKSSAGSGGGGTSGGLQYVLSDIQGSTRAIMSNNGSSSSVIARHDYLPFGEEIGAGVGVRSTGQGFNAGDTNRWKYGLTERDATTGLDHTWWRKYESLSGRWTSPDPMKGIAPQTLNAYIYTANDPVNYIDPNGAVRGLCPRSHDKLPRETCAL